MSADTLTTTSRAFYERARGKVLISIVTASAALCFLVFLDKYNNFGILLSY
jgi:hypothetical protein